MKNIFLLLIAIASLGSCYNINKPDESVPDPLLTKAELASILTEMHIVEASFVTNSEMRISRSEKPLYYKAILEKYEVSLDNVRDNLIYYQSQPKIMEGIYEDVLEQLSIYQSEIKAEITQKKIIEDSLKIIADSLNEITNTDSLSLPPLLDSTLVKINKIKND